MDRLGRVYQDGSVIDIFASYHHNYAIKLIISIKKGNKYAAWEEWAELVEPDYHPWPFMMGLDLLRQKGACV